MGDFFRLRIRSNIHTCISANISQLTGWWIVKVVGNGTEHGMDAKSMTDPITELILAAIELILVCLRFRYWWCKSIQSPEPRDSLTRSHLVNIDDRHLVNHQFNDLRFTRMTTYSHSIYLKYGHSLVMHYCDVIMGAMVSQITSPTIFYSTIHSGADQRKHQSSTSLAFERGINCWPVNSPHKWPVTRKMFPFDEVIMELFVMVIPSFVA